MTLGRLVALTLALAMWQGAAFAADRPIVIGASLSLSGAYSRTGEELRRGYEIWQTTVNERGGLLGRKVEFKFYDDQSDPTTGARLYERLVTSDKVDLVMGPFSSPVALAATTVTEKYGYPMVAAGSSARGIWERGYRYVFQLYARPENQLAGHIDLAKRHGARRLAVLTEDTIFSKELAQTFIRLAKEAGLEVVFYEEYGKGPTDLSAQLLKAKAQRPDILFGGTYLPESVLITRQAKELDLNAKMYIFTIGPTLPDYTQNLGKDAEYVLGLSEWEPILKLEGVPEFTDRYRKAYNATPGYQSAGGFAGCQVLEAAVKKVGSLDRDKIRDALAGIEVNTIWGPYKVNENGMQIGKRAYVIQIQKGERQLVWPEEHATSKLIYPTPDWSSRR
jgi:branched-chain amino acid transport system substrate-binding protein